MKQMSLRSRLLLGLLFGVGFAQAADGVLPLTPGAYVLASYKPCEEVPLAGVIEYDARQGLFGPHESDCTTTVLSHEGDSYRLSQTCLANGDGSRAAPATFDMTVRVKSPTAFFVTKDPGKGGDEYDLCPKFH